MNAFEGHPDGWGGIGDATVGEGVGGEQEAEVVGNAGQGDGDEWQQSEAEEQIGQADEGDGHSRAVGNRCERALDAGKEGEAEAWPSDDERADGKRHASLKEGQDKPILVRGGGQHVYQHTCGTAALVGRQWKKCLTQCEVR